MAFVRDAKFQFPVRPWNSDLEWCLMRSHSRFNPISFVLVCHSYPPVIGGSEIEAQRICEALIKRGYNVNVVCAGGSSMPDTQSWIDPKGVPVRIYARHAKGALKDIVFAFQVARMLICDRQKYQLVYFLMHGLHLAIGIPVARLLNKAILMKISSSIIIPILEQSISGRLELRWLRRWAHTVMILNEGVRQQAIDYGFPAQKLIWMPNPVDTDEFAPVDQNERMRLRRKLGIPSAALIVLYCGRLVAVKALPSLLEAFAVVSRRLPQAMLVLLGDGPLRTELMEHSERLRLRTESVCFAGRIDPGEIPSWLKIADVFALVSHSEGFSCALTEAMSASVACVVSDIPANRQLVADGEHGFLTPVGDSKAIAGAIFRLLEDDSLRDRMGRRARQTILDNYSTEKVIDRYEAVISAALAR
jgi:glycosyltransferase involved in cell wall biosynthesis